MAEAYGYFDLTYPKEKLFNLSIIKTILSLGLTEELKIKLFNRYCNLLDHPAILEAIENISTEVARLRANGKPKLEKNDANWKFAKFLEDNQYVSISENKKDPDTIRLNPKEKVLK